MVNTRFVHAEIRMDLLLFMWQPAVATVFVCVCFWKAVPKWTTRTMYAFAIDVEHLSFFSRFGFSELHCSVILVINCGYCRVLNFKLSQLYFYSQAQNGMTALHSAVMEGQNECVSLLLEAGANKEIKDDEVQAPCGFPDSII